MLKIQSRNWLRAVCAMLAALVVGLLALNYARSEQLRAAENRISAVYEKAFYETCELATAISGGYKKLSVAADDAQSLSLLAQISRNAQAASSNLALLPLGQQAVSYTLKFMNQAADYADVIGRKIAGGGEVSEEDYDAMLALSERAGSFSQELEQLLASYERGEAVFSAEDYAETGEETLYPLTRSAADYPVLLYDGPFSDGHTGGSYAMLDGAAEVTSEDARQILQAFIEVDEIAYLGESTPEIPIYEFQMQAGEYRISAGVTRQGGEVLYLLPETQNIPELYSEAQLLPIAEAFLQKKGFGPMQMSYSSRYDGVLTINYAATQDGVILYPDLVKVQLSMKDGRVIGFDARAYLKNHVQREIPQAAVAREEAISAAGPKLAVSAARMCIIPQDGKEYYCYELSASDGQDDFLAYIDAQSGVERELMQIVPRKNGTLVM